MLNIEITTGIVDSPDFGGILEKVSKVVVFPHPLPGPEVHVMIAISGIEGAADCNPSVSVRAEKITQIGFTAVFEVKGLGYNRLTAQFIAYNG